MGRSRGRRIAPLVLALIVLVTAGCAAPAAPRDRSGGGGRDLGAARVLRDLVYAHRDGAALRLDVYLPDARAPHPLVVHVHGGGWEAGDRRIAAGSAVARGARALLEHGYAVATVDYRLSGAAGFPAQVVDVAHAVRWLRERARTGGVDPGRIVLWGGSAGGHLVSLVAALGDRPDLPGGGVSGIGAVVNWYGPTDVTAHAQLAHPDVDQYARGAVRRLLGCMPLKCPRRAAAASPVRQVSGDEPPFLIQHGMADRMVPVEQSLDFAARLRELGVTVEMHPYAGARHGFSDRERTSMIVRTLLGFVEQHVPAS